MYCPIHNPSGGKYDPRKSQFKTVVYTVPNVTAGGTVWTRVSEKVPIVQKPFSYPDNLKADAACVAQLDNTKKIITDFAAITASFGEEAKRTYIINAKLLPSNSPARYVSTLLAYLTNERIYNRYDRFTKLNRRGNDWYLTPAYGSIDVMRCISEGSNHSPPGIGGTNKTFIGDSLEDTQAVTLEYCYLTGFNHRPDVATTDNPPLYLQSSVLQAKQERNLTLAETESLLKERIDDLNESAFTKSKLIASVTSAQNDMVFYPLDLLDTPLVWIDGNEVDPAFISVDNCSDLIDWFMPNDQFHVPNKQHYVDNGFDLATFNVDGSIKIRSNTRLDMRWIDREKRHWEENELSPEQTYTLY